MPHFHLDKVDPSLPLRHTIGDEKLQAPEQVAMAAALRAVIHDGHCVCCRPRCRAGRDPNPW